MAFDDLEDLIDENRKLQIIPLKRGQLRGEGGGLFGGEDGPKEINEIAFCKFYIIEERPGVNVQEQVDKLSR